MVFSSILFSMNKKNQTSGGEVSYLAFAFTKSVNLSYTLMVELLIKDKNDNKVMGTNAPINQTVLSSNSTMFTEGKKYNGSIGTLADGAIDTSSSAGWLQTGPHSTTQALIFYLDVTGLGINPDDLDGGSITSWTGISIESFNDTLYSVDEVEVYVPDAIPTTSDTYSAKSNVWRKLSLTHTNIPNRGTPYPSDVFDLTFANTNRLTANAITTCDVPLGTYQYVKFIFDDSQGSRPTWIGVGEIKIYNNNNSLVSSNSDDNKDKTSSSLTTEEQNNTKLSGMQYKFTLENGDIIYSNTLGYNTNYSPSNIFDNDTQTGSNWWSLNDGFSAYDDKFQIVYKFSSSTIFSKIDITTPGGELHLDYTWSNVRILVE